jgi:hypothetical protein
MEIKSMKKPLHKYILCCIVLLAITVSCNHKTEENLSTENSIFSEIPLIELPYEFTCGIDSYRWVSQFKSDSLKKIVSQTTDILGIIGKLPSIGNYAYIIYGDPGDIIYPYLYIYDSNLNVVNKLYLHIGYCASDEISESTTIINKDCSIEMCEKIQYIHYEDASEGFGDYVKDSLITSKKTYKLNKQHVFVATDSSVSVVR